MNQKPRGRSSSSEQMTPWKQQLLDKAEDMFDSATDGGKELPEEELKSLHASIGNRQDLRNHRSFLRFNAQRTRTMCR